MDIFGLSLVIAILIILGLIVMLIAKHSDATLLLVDIKDLLKAKKPESVTEKLQAEIDRLKSERDELRDEVIPELETEVKTLQSRRSIEDDEIKHMIRMKEERMQLAQEKFQDRCVREQEDAIADVKSEYAMKLQKRLETDIERGDSRFEKILARLPTAHIDMTEDRNTTRDQVKS